MGNPGARRRNQGTKPETPYYIEVNRYGGRFHLGFRSGLHLPQPKMSTEEFELVLRARDRCQAGMTAPLRGLSLVEVKY